MIRRLTIFGTGLIGGSLALALKQAHYCEQIIGCSRDIENLRLALKLGVVDKITLDVEEATEAADVILLAVPMRAMHSVLTQIKPALPTHTIITDAGSTKQSVIAEVNQVLGDDFSRFVPGHPIAGREQSGVAAALATLYQRRRVILTPTAYTDTQATAHIVAMWQQAGAIVEQMSAAEHDQVLAATSHLPHVLAFSLVDTLLNMPQKEQILRYAAGGFKDFTRIASSDPVMWRDICLTNRDAILAMIAAMQTNLGQFADLIAAENGSGLEQRMASAKQARDRFVAQYDAG